MSNIYDAIPREGMLYVVEWGYHSTAPMTYDEAKEFQRNFEQNARMDWFGNYIHPKIITWCEAKHG